MRYVPYHGGRFSNEHALALDGAWPWATLVPIDDRHTWHDIVNGFLDHNYHQEWDYSRESAERYGAQIERIAVRLGPDIVGAAVIRLKTIPLLRTGMAYIGGGPLVRRNVNGGISTLRTCLATFRREYVDARGYTLRVLPPLHPDGGYDAVTGAFRAVGFDPSDWPPPNRTIVVDINRPLEDIRKTLAQKWRNGLNNAERRNLVVQSGNSQELFEEFESIFNQAMDRKHISVEVGADFYTALRARGADLEGYYVNIAYVDGAPTAGQLVSLLGDTGVTLLAATGDTGLKCNASNLLQWDSIVEAHRRGKHWFDLGGIDPENQPGVYHFKCGLGGEEVANPGPFQAAPPGVKGFVTPTVERVYRWSRRHGLHA